jgi:hypothetical protein
MSKLKTLLHNLYTFRSTQFMYHSVQLYIHSSSMYSQRIWLTVVYIKRRRIRVKGATIGSAIFSSCTFINQHPTNVTQNVSLFCKWLNPGIHFYLSIYRSHGTQLAQRDTIQCYMGMLPRTCIVRMCTCYSAP